MIQIEEKQLLTVLLINASLHSCHKTCIVNTYFPVKKLQQQEKGVHKLLDTANTEWRTQNEN